MKDFLAIAKALADQSRLRALMTLAGGELCLCQIIAVLKLSPATVSKHMSQLYAAGLVERRKQGKWHYYRLAGNDAPANVRAALRFALTGLQGQPLIAADAQRCCSTRAKDLNKLTSCYSN